MLQAGQVQARRSGSAEPARSMAIFERAACAAFEKVPAFDRLHAVQHRLAIDEGCVARRTEELRGWRLRVAGELCPPVLPHCCGGHDRRGPARAGSVRFRTERWREVVLSVMFTLETMGRVAVRDLVLLDPPQLDMHVIRSSPTAPRFMGEVEREKSAAARSAVVQASEQPHIFRRESRGARGSDVVRGAQTLAVGAEEALAVPGQAEQIHDVVDVRGV
jgi:hypothetical protein